MFGIQGDLSFFQFGYLQDIIDQTQKLLAGKIDLRHIVFHFFPVVQMLFRQLRQSDDRVQRGTHIMGHIGEEGILGFLALPGGLQGLLQKLYLAQLLFLLVVHHAEAEHRLLGIEGFVEKKADIHPAVLAVENALEITAVIPDSSGYEASDILQGKACPEVFKYIRLHQFSHGVHKEIIISPGRDFSAHIVGTLDHVIGSPGKVHAIDGVKGISQNAHRLVRPAPGAVHSLLPDAHDHENRKEHQKDCHKPYGYRPYPSQKGTVRYGDNREPSVGGYIEIGGSFLLSRRVDIGAVAVKSPVFDPVDNGIYIALDLFTGNVGPGFRIQKRTG